jgi:hypothetical protein
MMEEGTEERVGRPKPTGYRRRRGAKRRTKKAFFFSFWKKEKGKNT